MKRQPIDSVKTLGLLVRARRRVMGRRLDEVAQQAGVGHVFVRHVEHGKDSVHLGKVFELLAELGVKLEVSLSDEEADAYAELSAKGGLRPVAPRCRVQ